MHAHVHSTLLKNLLWTLLLHSSKIHSCFYFIKNVSPYHASPNHMRNGNRVLCTHVLTIWRYIHYNLSCLRMFFAPNLIVNGEKRVNLIFKIFKAFWRKKKKKKIKPKLSYHNLDTDIMQDYRPTSQIFKLETLLIRYQCLHYTILLLLYLAA